MLIIFLLKIFIQKDRKLSLQRALLKNKTASDEAAYANLIYLTEKHKFKKPLNWEERVFLAKYYRSFQNERNGRTLRFMSGQSEQ